LIAYTVEAKELADANGIDIQTITGTGENGRILVSDVVKATDS